jgi:hypothetical protein
MGGGAARIRLSVGFNSPLERRVEVLEQNLERLEDEVDEKVAHIRNELGRVRTSVDEEVRSRQVEARVTSALLQDLAVGGLDLELAGLVWLLIGLLCTSIPEELAGLLPVI